MPYVAKKQIIVMSLGKDWRQGASIGDLEIPEPLRSQLLAEGVIEPLEGNLAPHVAPDAEEAEPPFEVMVQELVEEGVNATDAAIELAVELGIELSQVDGTGKGGRIGVNDVRHYAEEEGLV